MLQVINLNGAVLYNLPIGMTVKALIFKLGAYYYIITSNTTNELMVYRVVYGVR